MPQFEQNRKPSQQEWAAALGNLKKHGTELKGPCPVDGGTDRFSVGKDGTIYCRHCQPGKNNPDAFRAILEAAGFGKEIKPPRSRFQFRRAGQ